jgi:glycosyltransferase involved in cell wall biosynthesis
MRIAFFNRSYWPDQAATGQLLTELAEDLVARHGCHVTVVAGRALNPGADAEPESFPFSRATRNGVAILRASGTTWSTRHFAARASNYLSYLAAATAAARALGPQDIVVSLTDPPLVGRIALRTARRLGARFVFLCEDIFPEVASLLDDFRNPLVNRALDRTNRLLLRQADGIVSLGERMRRRLVEEKGADPDRLRVIHNWADCEAIAPGPKDNVFARRHGLADRFVIMHSGNVGLSQNLDVLIAAAARLRSFEPLLVAIVGSGAARDRLERLVADERLANVRFLPYQPKELLHESFAAADAFLVSLKAGIEGYIVPSKLYSILAAGRPFIAATDPSAEPAVLAREHHCGVWARPGDPDSLAAAIAGLANDPAGARRLGQAARDLSWRFDRRVAVQAYYDLFADVAAGRRAA